MANNPRPPTDHPYVSGHCGLGTPEGHRRCRGQYAGTVCACDCGHGAVTDEQIVSAREQVAVHADTDLTESQRLLAGCRQDLAALEAARQASAA